MGNVMTKRRWLWLVPVVFYAAFCFWYTGGGKLSQKEVAHFLELFERQGMATERLARLEAFMEADTGKQFFMLNAIDMAENPILPKGAKDGSSAGDLMNHYMEYMFPALFARACHPVFFGSAIAPAMDIVNAEGMEVWDSAALFRYRTRRDMLEIASNPAFDERHDYKFAALDKTIAYPTEATLYYADPRVMLFLILGLITALLDIVLFGRRKA